MVRAFVCVCLLLIACGHSKSREQTSSDAGAKPVALDRLLPSELSHSGALVFGFPIPQDMQVTRRYADSIILRGQLSSAALRKHVETHIVAGPSEVDGHRRIYLRARIRGGDPSRLYSLEIDEVPGERQLIISDTTPKPPTPQLSDEERWRRAGYLPDGTPIPSAQSM